MNELQKVTRRPNGPDLIYYLPKGEHDGERTQQYNESVSRQEIEDYVNYAINEYLRSPERRDILISREYYSGRTNIQNKKRYTFCGTKGTENSKLSNNKVNRNFLRKLVRQKKNYVFSKQFSINTENTTYQQTLEDEYFTKGMYTKISNVGKDSMLGAISWLRPFYDMDGVLQFEMVNNEQVIPVWTDIEHTELQTVLHFYTIDVLVGDEVISELKADYYMPGAVYHLKADNEGSTEGKYRIISSEHGEEETPTPKGNFVIQQQKTEAVLNKETGEEENVPVIGEDGEPMTEEIGMVWGRIPWIPFKYNDDEVPLLNMVKSSIDAYENRLSRFLDVVDDEPESIKVYKGYGGENLETLASNLAEFRAVLVDDDGGVEALQTPINTEPTKIALEALAAGIYEDGGGVNVQIENLGDKSGVALKFIYSDLDLDCDELINLFSDALEQLMFFVDADIKLKTNLDYSEEEVTFEFNKALIINTTEIIQNINDSIGFVPEKTLLSKHPFVDDVEQAIKDKEEEEVKNQEKQLENMALLGLTEQVLQDDEEEEENE